MGAFLGWPAGLLHIDGHGEGHSLVPGYQCSSKVHLVHLAPFVINLTGAVQAATFGTAAGMAATRSREVS